MKGAHEHQAMFIMTITNRGLLRNLNAAYEYVTVTSETAFSIYFNYFTAYCFFSIIIHCLLPGALAEKGESVKKNCNNLCNKVCQELVWNKIKLGISANNRMR